MARSVLAPVVLLLLVGSVASPGAGSDSWAVRDVRAPASLLWEEVGGVSIEVENDGDAEWGGGYALLSVDQPTAPFSPAARWGLLLVPEAGVTPPVAPEESRRFDFSVIAPPWTTLAYEPGGQAETGAADGLACYWALARDGQPVVAEAAGEWVVISRFPDIQPGTTGAWARFYIEECAGRLPHIVAGYGDGTYRPEYPVSRDQMAVFVSRAARYETPPPFEDVFPDVPADHWAAAEILACVQHGVVRGYPDGLYLPEGVVDRAQMAVFIARAKGYEVGEPQEPPFDDVPTDFWAAGEIAACAEQGIVAGYGDRTYRPEVVVSRDQMAVFAWRAFVRPTHVAVVLGGPAFSAVDPAETPYYGWSSPAAPTTTDPGFAYIAFDAARLGPGLAAGEGGRWEVSFELRRQVGATWVIAARTAVSLTPSELEAARQAALASGDPYLVVYWDLRGWVEAGEHVLVVSVQNAAGEVHELPRQPRLIVGSGRVLILYDHSGEWAWLGELYGMQLANLIGHFPVAYDMRPVEGYLAGEMDQYAATFYVGTTWDNALPQGFLDDVMQTDTTVCWLGYNLWQLAWVKPEFESRFGFGFDGLSFENYDVVYYKGQALERYGEYLDLGIVTVLDRDLCREWAMACVTQGPQAGECTPYVTQGRNLWYVGDVPFSYVTEEDRYLAFADLLHDVLGFHHAQSRRAVIRIEDVDPLTPPEQLRAIADLLHAEGVPFAVALIPAHYDPLGVYSGGVPLRVTLSERPELADALHYMVARGGSIVLHGYTHQYSSVPNPYTGASRDDYEFYRVELGPGYENIFIGPVPEESEAWVQARLDAARAELDANGLAAVAWETPHYTASPLAYRVFAANFPLTIQRVFYTLVSEPDGELRFLDQLFPYVIEQDVYGQRIVPENVGHVDPYGTGPYGARFPEDVLRAAEKNLVVRDGWASTYFHPFLDLDLLEEVVQGIKALGYRFVSLSSDWEAP